MNKSTDIVVSLNTPITRVISTATIGPRGPQGEMGPSGDPAVPMDVILQEEKGAINGVASLDDTAHIPDEQIPESIARDADVTAEVAAAIAAIIDASPAALNTLNELAAALGDDENYAATVTNLLSLKAPLESPTFTGVVTIPALSSENISSVIVKADYFTNITNTGAYLSYIDLDGSALIQQRTSNLPALITAGAAGQTANLQEWRNSAGTVVASLQPLGGMIVGAQGSQRFNVNNSGFASTTVSILPAATSWAGLVVQALPGQTGNLQEWQNSGGAAVASIQPLGGILLASGKFQIDSAGRVGRNGVVPWADAMDYIAATHPSAAGAIYGQAIIFTTPSTATFVSNYYSSISTAAAAFNLTDAYNYLAYAPGLGAGSTIGTLRGFYALNQGNAAVTNAYGIEIEAQSGSAVNIAAKLSGGTQANLWLNSDVVGPGGGIVFGTARDAFIARGAAGYLYTQGAFGVVAGIYTSEVSNPASGNNSLLTLATTGAQITTGEAANVALRVRNTHAAPTANLQEWQNSVGGVVASVKPDGAVLLANGNWQVDSAGRMAQGGVVPQPSIMNYQSGVHPNTTANSYWHYLAPLYPATTVGSAVNFVSGINTVAAVFVVGAADCFRADFPGVGAGSTITSLAGFHSQNQGATGITNAYGIQVDAQSGAAGLNVAARLDGGTFANLWLNSNVVGPGGGILFGTNGDISLYRETAQFLKSSGGLILGNMLDVSNPVSYGVSVHDAQLYGGVLGLRYVDTGAQATSYGYLEAGDSGAYRSIAINPNGGSVAIGTTYPDTGVRLHVAAGSAATTPLLIKGHAGQTANLQEWRDSSGGLYGSISAGFIMNMFFMESNYYTNADNTGAYLDYAVIPGTASIIQRIPSVAGLVVRGAASQTANLQEWQNSAGIVFAVMTAEGRLASKYIRVLPGGYLDNNDTSSYILYDAGSPNNLFSAVNAAHIPLVIKGAAWTDTP